MPPLPPRVAVDAAFATRPETGSGQYLRLLAEGLPRLNRPPQLRLFGPLAGALDGLTVEKLATPFDGLSGNLAKVWREQIAFPRAARAAGAGLAHVPYFAPPLWPQRPTVVTIHDLIPLILPEYAARPLVRLYNRLVSAAAHRASAVLTDSQASRRDVLERLGLPADKVRVVYLGLGERWFVEPPRAAPESFRTRLRLPPSYLLYLGGYNRRKNVPLLLRAYRRILRPETPPLVLAGELARWDNPLLGDLRRQGKLLTPGWIEEPDKPLLYRGALALVYPSLYEGFGLPPLEAMACGAPVVTSEGSSLPEVVGDAGLAVPAQEEPLAAALERLLGEPELRAELGRRGRERARRFTAQATAQATAAVYEAVAAGQALPPQQALGDWPVTWPEQG